MRIKISIQFYDFLPTISQIIKSLLPEPWWSPFQKWINIRNDLFVQNWRLSLEDKVIGAKTDSNMKGKMVLSSNMNVLVYSTRAVPPYSFWLIFYAAWNWPDEREVPFKALFSVTFKIVRIFTNHLTTHVSINGISGTLSRWFHEHPTIAKISFWLLIFWPDTDHPAFLLMVAYDKLSLFY